MWNTKFKIRKVRGWENLKLTDLPIPSQKDSSTSSEEKNHYLCVTHRACLRTVDVNECISICLTGVSWRSWGLMNRQSADGDWITWCLASSTAFIQRRKEEELLVLSASVYFAHNISSAEKPLLEMLCFFHRTWVYKVSCRWWMMVSAINYASPIYENRKLLEGILYLICGYCTYILDIKWKSSRLCILMWLPHAF